MSPISAKTLVRWVDMIQSISTDLDDVKIWMAETIPATLTSYKCELKAPEIDPDTILVKGDYAYYDPSKFTPFQKVLSCVFRLGPGCSDEMHSWANPLMISYIPNYVFQKIQDRINKENPESPEEVCLAILLSFE